MSELNVHFLDRMKSILGEEYEDFISSLNNPLEKAIYVNENKIDIQEFKDIIDFKITTILYERAGFYVDEAKLGRHPLHHVGAFYIQEPSAMFTINSFEFKGDERVLDMCSAPGGKTIQIANRIPEGLLVSNEIVKDRCDILYSNIERMGLKNVIITNDSPDNIAKAYGDSFDVCLVDAPCSGEGMFRRGSEVIREWNENLPSMCADRQMNILASADKVLKQGGHLIYSTCTYSLEENEQVVKQFATQFGYKILPISANFERGIGLKEAVRLYPHKVKGEGQFVCLLKKLSPNEYSSTSQLRLKESKLASEFMRAHTKIDMKTYEYKGKIYTTKDTNLIKKGINYYSIGVRLGEEKKDRFEPDHDLFTAFGGKFKTRIDYDYREGNVAKYLRGETLEAEIPNGYCAILLNGCSLGGGKATNGIVKNHYPKGLRNFK